MARRRDHELSDRQWHLDKKVPVAIIIAITLQSVGAVWWASAIDQRVKSLEVTASATAATSPIQAERLTRVESKVESAVRDLAEIKADVKSLIRRDPARP